MRVGGLFLVAGVLCAADCLGERQPESCVATQQVETAVALSNRFGRARVELRGANLCSWCPAGAREVLGRLGVPIYGPWAIYEGAPGCDIHGLTPYFDWTVRERSADRVVLELNDDEATRRVWWSTSSRAACTGSFFSGRRARRYETS